VVQHRVGPPEVPVAVDTIGLGDGQRLLIHGAARVIDYREERFAELAEAGRLEVRVDRVFDLDEAPAAHRAAEDHHGGGKIVIRVP